MSATKEDFEEDKKYSLGKAVFKGKSPIQLFSQKDVNLPLPTMNLKCFVKT
jgi:hypothetical protein